MKKKIKINVGLTFLLVMIEVSTAFADGVQILVADFVNSGGNLWSVDVTLDHGDTGWDHYADKWRVSFI